METQTVVPEVAQEINKQVMEFASGTSTVQLDLLLQKLSELNAFANGMIGLCITIVIIAFFVYLITWLFSSQGTELEKESIKGAMRSFLVIFIMVNIWFIVRVLQWVANISPVVATLVFTGVMILTCFWSLFGLGAAVSNAMSATLNAFLDIAVSWYRRLRGIDEHDLQSKWQRYGLRLTVFFVIGVLFTAIGFFAIVL